VSAGLIGYILGAFMAAIVLPVILLIVFRFTPLRSKPKISYGVAGVLAVLLALVGTNGQPAGILVAVLAAAFFVWGYIRATASAPRVG
jgi:hypothetical protein